MGRIVKLRPGSKTGIVESLATGRQVPFEWPLVRLIGAGNFDALKLGMEVGFDVSWTSRGLRVSVLKVFSTEDKGFAEEQPAARAAPSIENEKSDDSF